MILLHDYINTDLIVCDTISHFSANFCKNPSAKSRQSHIFKYSNNNLLRGRKSLYSWHSNIIWSDRDAQRGIGVTEENLHRVSQWIHKSSRIAHSVDGLQPVAGFCAERGAPPCILYRIRDQTVAKLSSKVCENRSIVHWTLRERQHKPWPPLRHTTTNSYCVQQSPKLVACLRGTSEFTSPSSQK